MAIQNLEVDLDLKQNLNIYATCKQLDNLTLVCNIYDNSVQADLTNYNVKLRAMKADKVPLIQDTDINILNNVATIEASEQLTTTSGKTLIELQFIEKTTGLKKATFNLVLNVVASVLEVDRTISTATYTLLQELENKLDQASDFLENIEEASEMNETLNDTFATAINTIKPALDSSVSSSVFAKIELDSVNTMAQALKDEILGLAPSINNHIDDEDIHVTKSEKDNWNSRWAMIEQILNLVDILIANSPILTETGDTIVTEDGSILTV